MGKLSEQRRCGKCGNKSYTDFVGKLEIITYSCRCGNVFSKIGVHENYKLAHMIEDNPETFYNLPISDVIQLLEEDAFRNEKLVNTYFYEQEKTKIRETISGLSSTCRSVFWVINEIDKKKGFVEQKELYAILRREENIKSEMAEKCIEELLETGCLYRPREGLLKCTFSFDNKMKKD